MKMVVSKTHEWAKRKSLISDDEVKVWLRFDTGLIPSTIDDYGIKNLLPSYLCPGTYPGV